MLKFDVYCSSPEKFAKKPTNAWYTISSNVSWVPLGPKKNPLSMFPAEIFSFLISNSQVINHALNASKFQELAWVCFSNGVQ